MDTSAKTLAGPVLRPARSGDPDEVEALAQLWHSGWQDGHLGHVPPELLEYRQLDAFRKRLPQRLPHTTVAELDGRLAGLVTVLRDELEQLYVAAWARGTGTAAVLLRHGEQIVARSYPLAWLSVVEGNARARHFYEREGWHDAGFLAYQAQIEGGTLPVPCRRYEIALE